MDSCNIINTPVAFLIFNRPDTTERVFQVIRQAKPPQLLVVADGPRSKFADEAQKCQAARAIIDRVDWDCEVLTNYSDINLGCKTRVSSGLDWVFDTVEKAIILEDDCLPHLSFFRFCEELLDFYQSDRRIMTISGNNFQFGRKRTEYSYYFSRYCHCWGWATWRRAWRLYDIEMKLWPRVKNENLLEHILEDSQTVKYWERIFQRTYNESINSWAYRWKFACWIHSGLTVLPNVNLVSNIGFGVRSTHTTNKQNLCANLPVEKMYFPLQHPPFMLRNVEADRFTQNTSINPPLAKRLVDKIQKVFS